MKSRLLACVVASLVLGLAPEAIASPWTLSDEELLLSLSYDFQTARNEYLPDGTFQSFPLDGRFTSNSLRLNTRYGFTDRFEGSAEVSFKSVNYVADAVVLSLPEGQDSVDLAGARASVRNFSTTQAGAADVFLGGRYNFYKGLIALTSETLLKFPTGYEEPQATFSEEGLVADDVALGDAQTDIEQSLLLGLFVPPTRSFVRFDAGFRFRFGAPGHQLVGGARAGQFLGKRLVLVAGARANYTVVEGEPIGNTWIATVDDLKAEDVSSDTVTAVPLLLDKDWLSADGGLIFLFSETVEMQAAYGYLLLGRNIPAVHSVTVSTAIRFPAVEDLASP